MEYLGSTTLKLVRNATILLHRGLPAQRREKGIERY